MNPEDEVVQQQDQQQGEPAGSPSVASMSNEEYNRRAVAAIRALRGQDPEGDVPEQDEEQHGWFYKLLHGPEGQSKTERTFEVVSAVGRGAVKGIGNTLVNATSGFQALGAKLDNPFLSAEEAQAEGRERTKEKFEQVNKVATAAFGENTGDDPLVSLTEGIAQFTAPFVLTGKVGGAAGEGASLADIGHAAQKAGGIAGWAKATALAASRGALTDASAFDPFEAQLAEWAATSKWKPLADLGQALSVGEADSEAIARAKRAAAGLVPGILLDTFFGGLKLVGAFRKAGNKSLSAAERAAAVQEAEEAAKQIEAAQNGTRVAPPNEHIVAKVNPDGTATLGLNPNSAQRGSLRKKLANLIDPERRALDEENQRLRREVETDPMTGLGNKQAFERARAAVDADPKQHWVLFDLNNFKALNDAFGQALGDDVIKTFANVLKAHTSRGFRIGGDEFIAATDDPDALRDAVEAAFGFEREGIRSNASGEIFATSDEAMSEQGKTLLKERKNARKTELGMALTREEAEKQAAEAVAKRAQEPEAIPGAPTFATVAEAEEAAATANGAIDDAIHDGKLTDEEQVELAKRAHEIAQAKTPADAAKLIDGTVFNFHYYTDTDENLRGLIEAVAEKFRDAFNAAQNRPQGIPVEEFIARTLTIIRGMPEEEAPIIAANLLKQGEGRSFHALAGDAIHKYLGKQLADMAEALRNSPDDVGLHEQFRHRFAAWFRLSRQLSAANTDWGLQGRMMQERANVKLREGLKFAKQAAKRAEKEAASIKEDLKAAKKEVEKAAKAAKKAAKQAKTDAEKEAAREAELDKQAQPGPNTETVADVADIAKAREDLAEQAKAEAEASGEGAASGKEFDPDAQPLNASRDTIGPNANDFILARARTKAMNAIERLKRLTQEVEEEFNPESEQALDNASLRGERVKMQADAQRANPLEAPEVPQTPKSVNPIEELSKLIEKAERDLDNTMERVRRGKKQGPKELDPVQQFKRQARQAEKEAKKAQEQTDELAKQIAGMSRKKLRQVARTFEMAEGDPNGPFAVQKATEVIWADGWGPKVIEFFTNALLSGPKTALTALGSGTAVTVFEPAMRILGGLTHADRTLVQRGARLMWGNAVYFKENLKSMILALKRGSSVINPTSQTKAIRHFGEVVRAPGRLLAGVDEFIRVTNYRSYVRMKSLEFWEQKGLTGKALRDAVEEDVKNAFDETTGEALLPEAMRYAERPTFSGPLEWGPGKKIHEFVNEFPALKFIVPFVKASTHLWRYAHEMTPGLNRFSKLAREIREAAAKPDASPEAIQALHTLRAKETVASLIGVTTAYAFLEGRITGRGPADPKLRAVWLGDGNPEHGGHQPYSVRVGNKWVSYRRVDPFATPIGLIADAMTFLSESDTTNDTEMEDVVYAAIASIASNFTSKTYMLGLAQFTSAITSGRAHETERWLQGLAGGLAVPNLVASLNPDPLYREVDGLLSTIAARVPGWSETLMPRYNALGEPMMKQQGLLNRGVNPLGTKPTQKDIIADKLLDIRYAWRPPAVEKDGIDLSDWKWDTRKTGKRPYERWMELVSNPGHGQRSLREDLEETLSDPAFNEYSPGTDEYPGGVQAAKIRGIVARHYARAKRRMLLEYPELADAIRQQKKLEGAAFRGGQSAVDEMQEMFSR